VAWGVATTIPLSSPWAATLAASAVFLILGGLLEIRFLRGLGELRRGGEDA
jgi:hypothetical protein